MPSSHKKVHAPLTDFDLRNIDPRYWETARARSEAIQAYISLQKRSGAERNKLAAKIGISANLFSRLLVNWKAGQGVNGLMVGRRGAQRASTRVHPRSREIMFGAIDFYGTSGTFKEIKAAVLEQCSRENLAAPSKGTIHYNLMRARSERGAANLQPMIVAGELRISLPYANDNNDLERPKMLVAVDVATRNIIAHRVMGQCEAPDYLSLLSEVRDAGHTLPVLMDEAVLHVFADDTISDLEPTFESRAAVRRRLCHTFGSYLDGLQITYRPTNSRSLDRMLVSTKAKVVSLVTATKAVDLAVQEHNRKWPAAG